MRGYFKDTITLVSGGNLQPLDNVQVSVFLAGTTGLATIYGSRNPADVTPLANPMTTGASGSIEFWAESGEYDIALHDLNGPARIADKTYGWQSLSAQDGGIPSVKLAGDAALPYAAMGAVAQRQFVPLGTVIDWWRPSSTYDAGAGAGNAPPGYEICDGRTVLAANHGFGGGDIVLPDLRNKFVIGADILKTDGAASVAGDGTAVYNAQHPNAPGIRGTGGANAVHNHTVPAHFHGKGTLSASGGSHAHTDNGHGHGASQASHTHVDGASGFLVGQNDQGWGGFFAASGGGGTVTAPRWGGTNGVAPGVSVGTGAAQIAANTHSHPNSEFSGLVGLTTGVSGDAAMTAGNTDGRPAHYGLLKIMKVRRA